MGPAAFAERCILTVLAVDTVDSTGHVADLDPDKARELLDRIFDHVSHSVDHAGGLLVSFTGDGGIAIFGWPKSLEDHADRACEAAWRIQEPAVQANPLRGGDGRSVHFRVGVHSGLASLRPTKRDPRAGVDIVGGVVHLAAALQKNARPDHILISSRTLNLCRAALQLTPYDGSPALQKVRLKAFQLAAPPQSRASPMVFRSYRFPFFGRETERRLLRATLIERCGAVALIGEPGIGKTRLAATAVDEARWKGMRVLAFTGDSQRRTTPFWAMRALILQSLSLGPMASASDVRDAYSARAIGDMKPFAATVMLEEFAAGRSGPEPSSRSQVARDLIDALAAVERGAPALIVVDDLQLVDPESVLCLRMIPKANAQPRFSLLMTGRAEAAGQARMCADKVLNLGPLPREDMLELASALWRGAGPGTRLVDRLLDRADGVPFVLEQFALSEDPGDADSAIALPDSVQSLIHARLNRLSAKAKTLAQTLSILGEEVDVDLAVGTLRIEKASLMRNQSELERLGLVHPIAAGAIRFRHAIVAEACAETVNTTRREQIHRAAMEAIRTAGDVERHCERLAFHAEGAHDDEKALEYLWLAAVNARRASAVDSLYLTFTRAMTCIERIGEPAEPKFVDFVLMAFGSLAQIGEFRSLAAYLPRALELARKQNRKAKICAALCHLGMASFFAGRYAESRGHSERAIEIAYQLDSLPLIFAASFNLASALSGLGLLRPAIALHHDLCTKLSGNLETARLGAAGIPASISRSYLCWFLTETGEYDEGLTHVERAIAIAKQAGEPYSELLALNAKGRALLRLNRFAEAITCLEEGVALIERHGYDVILPHLLGTLASALARSGSGGRAIAQVSDWLKREREHRTGPLELFQLNAGYAEALAASGETEQALERANRALDISRQIESPCLIAHGLGVRARLRVKAGDANGAKADLAEQEELCRRYAIVADA
ncbi:MAG: tetratricopeptide repeat protein [Hyphomicrobiales bacterium]|nr:tetratricopeptide repeat protein [Hyphomicrobiales bacterium]MBV8440846.1 tetratricopeptide repeat protein [Hyphomicrobiales bacterium]